jgi:hypothetical protein
MLPAAVVRTLTTDAPLAHGNRFVSSASGLVRVGDRLLVIGDDAHHLALFPADGDEPGTLHRIVPGDPPPDAAARKRVKPDFEAIVLLPGGDVLIVGSGSTPQRETAIRIPVDADGVLGEPTALSLAPLFTPLRRACGGEINVEAAGVLSGQLVLISRAHGGRPVNHMAQFSLRDLDGWWAGEDGHVEPRSVTTVSLGAIDHVPLGITDATVHPDGVRLVVGAVAEDTDNSYDDGVLAGAAVAIITAEGAVAGCLPLADPLKVEGILATATEGGVGLTMVTDADDPDRPAKLLRGMAPGWA